MGDPTVCSEHFSGSHGRGKPITNSSNHSELSNSWQELDALFLTACRRGEWAPQERDTIQDILTRRLLPANPGDEKLSRLVRHWLSIGGSLGSYQIVHAHLQYHHASLWHQQDTDQAQVQNLDRTQYQSGQHAIYLICENLRSAWNVGAILRVADCLGLKKVYLCGFTPKPGQHAEISSSALGADLKELWEARLDAREALQELKQQAVPCYGLETATAAKNLLLEQPKLPLALVLGNERWGVLPSTIQHLDGLYQLPTFGKKNSLNVAVAAGAALYAIIKPTAMPC